VTDGRTDGQTDGIAIAYARLAYMLSRAKINVRHITSGDVRKRTVIRIIFEIRGRTAALS